MKKEYLENLKNKIGSLDAADLNERMKYLQALASGKLQGPPVGYQSIDNSWLKYYDLNNQLSNANETVYQSLLEHNQIYLDKIAIEYFYSKISFGSLLKNISNAAKAFVANDVKKYDFVTICAPGIPETVYSFYALSKIGAVANMIAPYFDKNNFVERIADCNSKLLIVMDEFYDEIKDAVKKSKIEKVVVVPTLNSSPLKLISKKYKIDKNNSEVYWNDFIKEGNKVSKTSTINYEPNLPLTMVYSSGTTGAAKGILLSNDSFQNSVNAYFASGLNISRGQKFYQIIPTWYSTGISTSVHLPLVCGATLYMDPRFERNVFVNNIIHAKPNYCVAPTSMYEGLLNNPKLKNKDLSYFYNAFEGGEPLSRELSERINQVFAEHGNNHSIKVGYGQCECGATITTQTDITEHCNGSVGIPLPGINIQICDDNLNEVLTGERGQIVVRTPSSMSEYYKNENASQEYFYIDSTNKRWNCTGDIGYMDINGNLYVEGRASDYSIINGEKIYNFDVEGVIKNIPGIKLCDVLAKKDSSGNDNLVAHIILDNNIICDSEDKGIFLEKIQSVILDTTKNINMVPFIFKIRKDFPYAKSGKRDIQKLQSETDGFIYLNTDLKNKPAVKVLKKK